MDMQESASSKVRSSFAACTAATHSSTVREATRKECDGEGFAACDVGDMRRANEDNRRSEKGLFRTDAGMGFWAGFCTGF